VEARTGLAGRTVLVTAAGQGIGRACAEVLRNVGATVFATDRDGATLSGLEGIVTEVVDATDYAATATFVAEHGAFDAVVHCVGSVPNGTILDCTPDEWANTFRINVDSFYHLLQAVLPGMRSRGGSVTCIASVASSIKGLPNRAAYGASKAAMIGMVKSVAADFAADDIRCNAVCPGTILSPSLEGRIAALGETMGDPDKALAQFVGRQPLGRLGTPEEVAGLCLYLASDAGRFVTGQAIAIDGGISI
jgi:2-keto-3-deoxy-L-fuconate dehydrogenase